MFRNNVIFGKVTSKEKKGCHPRKALRGASEMWSVSYFGFLILFLDVRTCSLEAVRLCRLIGQKNISLFKLIRSMVYIAESLSHLVNSCDLPSCPIAQLSGHHSPNILHERCFHKVYKYGESVKSKLSDCTMLDVVATCLYDSWWTPSSNTAAIKSNCQGDSVTASSITTNTHYIDIWNIYHQNKNHFNFSLSYSLKINV